MRRDYIALCGILVSAFLLFLFFSTCDSPEVAGIKIKSSKLAESVFGKPDTGSVAPVSSAAAKAGSPEAPADSSSAPASADSSHNSRVVLDAGPHTVLIIGDSMLEGLCMRLGAYCHASGHTLYGAIWYGSTTELFGESKLMSDYIAKYRPEYIFLSLGGNELFVSDIAEKRDKYVKSILAEIGDIPYLWIAPPNWKPDTGINDLIMKNNPEGCVFLSNTLEFERKHDGAHPTAESAAAWMDSIIRWMPAHARYVLPMQQPEVETMRPHRLLIHQPGPLTDRPK